MHFISDFKHSISMLLSKSVRKIKEAIDSESIPEIERVVRKNPKICEFEVDAEGDTPLGYAIKAGSLASIKKLLELGSNIGCVNIPRQIGALALLAGLENTNESHGQFDEIVRFLIQSGCDVNESFVKLGMTDQGVSYAESVTPLTEAIQCANVDIATILIEEGNADVNYTCPDTLHSPLLWAAAIGSTNLILILMKHKVKFDSVSSDGNNALHWLKDCKSHKDTATAVECLVKKGVDINGVNSAGQTPLMNAALRNDCELVKVLIEKGANVSATDHSNIGAMEYAINAGCETCYERLKNAFKTQNPSEDHHNSDPQQTPFASPASSAQTNAEVEQPPSGGGENGFLDC